MAQQPDKSSPYIFVSYATKDLPILQPEIDALRAQSISLWVDDGVPLSTLPWKEADSLARVVRRSTGFMAFATADWASCGNALDELLFAFHRRRPVALVQLVEEWPDPRVAKIAAAPTASVIRGLPKIASGELLTWSQSLMNLARLQDSG